LRRRATGVGHGDEIIRECLDRDGGQVDDSLLMSVRLRVLLGARTGP